MGVGLRGHAHGMDELDTTRIPTIVATDSNKRKYALSVNETEFGFLSPGPLMSDAWSSLIDHDETLNPHHPFSFATCTSLSMRCMSAFLERCVSVITPSAITGFDSSLCQVRFFRDSEIKS